VESSFGGIELINRHNDRYGIVIKRLLGETRRSSFLTQHKTTITESIGKQKKDIVTFPEERKTTCECLKEM
jgi:hypothetical protein